MSTLALLAAIKKCPLLMNLTIAIDGNEISKEEEKNMVKDIMSYRNFKVYSLKTNTEELSNA